MKIEAPIDGLLVLNYYFYLRTIKFYSGGRTAMEELNIYLGNGWHGLNQLDKFVETVAGHAALVPVAFLVGGHEVSQCETLVRLALQQ